jgi:hypothetical protein
MVLAPSVAGLFKWRQFEPEMILPWLPDDRHFLYTQLQELKPGQSATEKYFDP